MKIINLDVPCLKINAAYNGFYDAHVLEGTTEFRFCLNAPVIRIIITVTILFQRLLNNVLCINRGIYVFSLKFSNNMSSNPEITLVIIIIIIVWFLKSCRL